MLLASIPLFADIAQPSAAFAGNFLIVAIAVVGCVAGLFIQYSMLQSSRRQNELLQQQLSLRHPPLGEEVHKMFVPREEYHTDITRLHERVNEAEEVSTGINAEMRKGFQDIERSLGRIEGKLDR